MHEIPVRRADRHDDIEKLSATARARLIRTVRRRLPADFKEARITLGIRLHGSGWAFRIVTDRQGVGKPGKPWYAWSLGRGFKITPA